MAAESFRERDGLQADADFAFYFLDFAEAVGEGGLAVAHAWLECRARVGEGSSGDCPAWWGSFTFAQGVGEADGASVLRPAFHPPPRAPASQHRRLGDRGLAPIPRADLEAAHIWIANVRAPLIWRLRTKNCKAGKSLEGAKRVWTGIGKTVGAGSHRAPGSRVARPVWPVGYGSGVCSMDAPSEIEAAARH